MVVPGPPFLIRLVWVLWLLSWLAAAPWSSRTERQLPAYKLWLSHLAVMVGSVLLFGDMLHRLAGPRLWGVDRVGGFALAFATVASLAFTWWGRIHLGRLWSGTITRKEAHRVVDTGPYALVRHPIYAGLIAATLATATAEATLPALAGCAAIAFGLRLKARFEEVFLTQELGPDYAAYRRRVPMLVPFGRKAGT
jgi:protein-S-isoprenylcysteine O-methyltransferase Ste14